MWYIEADTLLVPREDVYVLTEEEYFALRDAADRWYRVENQIRENLSKPYIPPMGFME